MYIEFPHFKLHCKRYRSLRYKPIRDKIYLGVYFLHLQKLEIRWFAYDDGNLSSMMMYCLLWEQ